MERIRASDQQTRQPPYFSELGGQDPSHATIHRYRIKSKKIRILQCDFWIDKRISFALLLDLVLNWVVDQYWSQFFVLPNLGCSIIDGALVC